MKSKNIIISAGTHGIGFEILKSFSDENNNIAFFSSTASRVRDVEEYLHKEKVNFISKVVDVLDENEVNGFCNEVKDKWDKVDILINNVGGGGSWGKESFLETNTNVWNEVYQKNVKTAIVLTKFVLPFMKKNKWGRVITIASSVAKKSVGRPWYLLAKKAEVSLMKSFSIDKEFVRSGITFNSVSPGAIMIEDTGWHKKYIKDPEDFNNMLNENFPMGRLGKPEEVADLVQFLCSEKASFINGEDICIDGGQSNREFNSD